MFTKHPYEFYRLVFVVAAALLVVGLVARLAGCIEFHQPPQGITDGELGR